MTFPGVFSELQAHGTSTDKWMGPLCTDMRSLPKTDGNRQQETNLELGWLEKTNGGYLAVDISHQGLAMTSQEIADSLATSLRLRAEEQLASSTTLVKEQKAPALPEGTTSTTSATQNLLQCTWAPLYPAATWQLRLISS